MHRFRIGVFGRSTSARDGGADTLLQSIGEALGRLSLGDAIELVEVPWSAWSHRRRPLRYAWGRIVRWFGGEIPQVDLRPLCRRRRLDAAYFTAPAFARIDVPFVFTVWDLGHRTIPEFPEMRRARDPWTLREATYRRMLAQASFVVTGNAAGAAELRELFGVAQDRIAIAPFPNPPFEEVEEKVPAWMPSRPFFLYPAQFWAHKNHATVVKAMALLAQRAVEGCELVFVGADKGNMEFVRELAAELKVSDSVRFAGFVERSELKALYRRATALVFPSLLGPNNLPPQEAAVLGCAAILSDLPGHREQLGEGAWYVRGIDAVAWADAMERTLRDAELRSALTARARAAVAACTPSAYAEVVGRLLVQLAARRGLWGR